MLIIGSMPRGQSTSYKSKASSAAALIQETELRLAKSTDEYRRLKASEAWVHPTLIRTLKKAEDLVLESNHDEWLRPYLLNSGACEKDDFKISSSSIDLSSSLEKIVERLLDVNIAYSAIVTELASSMVSTGERIQTVLDSEAESTSPTIGELREAHLRSLASEDSEIGRSPAEKDLSSSRIRRSVSSILL